MILSTIFAFMALTSKPSVEQCVAIYEQNRSPSKLDRCLDLVTPPVSQEAVQLLDLCNIIRNDAKARGYALQSATLVRNGKPLTCEFRD
jgi:hypothetical protein